MSLDENYEFHLAQKKKLCSFNHKITTTMVYLTLMYYIKP